jgi:glycosyltransferase involved in cell wall biosynthesis
MKFSLITPTNSITYLPELYQSILKQTYKNWEWILYLNGKVSNTKLPQEFYEDERIKITVDTPTEYSENVGYLKNTAFKLGTGEILVEVDHDDLLVPECLERLHKAFSDNPDIGFVYSNTAIISDNFVDYDSSVGWKFENFEWEGKQHRVPLSFEPSAQALSTIWWAPDHVRAWRKKIYLETGGHDVNLSILDDQDLMIRTYLITPFHYIPETLYLYRVHGGNTWLERNEQIQTGTVDLARKWIPRLAEVDAERKNLKKISISLNGDKKPGFISVGPENCDIYWNFKDKLPFEESTVGVVEMYHVLQKLKDPINTVQEVFRVLDDMGWLLVEVPSTDGRGAFQDPTHLTYWNENSFWYYTNTNYNRFIPNNSIRFQDFFTFTTYPDDWWRQNNIPVVRAYLSAIKNDKIRRPGKINI